MKTTFLTLILLVFGFSSFAFMPSFPAENNSVEKNMAVTSEKPKAEIKAEAKTETKTVTAKELAKQMEANYQVNKKEMSLKERIANKLIIKNLKKVEKNQIKDSKQTKDANVGAILRVLGIIFVIVGAVFIITAGSVSAGIGILALGVILLILPSLL